MNPPGIFPRLLFVTPHAFNHVTGGGVAFTNLFRGWPADRLLTVHNDPEPTSDEVCRLYYRLGPEEIDLAEPYASARRLLRRGQRSMAAPSAGIGSTASEAGLKSAIKQAGVRLLGEAFPERATLTPELEARIAAFDPDVLYTILGSTGMMALIERILERFDIPLVVHFMDDWPAAAHRSGLLAAGVRRRMEAQLQRLIGRAADCLAISPTMATTYGTRYGRGFRAFQNAVDVAKWKVSSKTDLTTRRPAELLYVGSIFPNAQLDSLIDCARAVAALHDGGFPVRLAISTPSGHGNRYCDRLAIHPAVRIEETIRDDAKFYARIAAADALLIPVNFDANSVRFIQYSMPAKTPAYMVSGTPILMYGSPATSQVQYALEAGWAHVVDKRDGAALQAGIRVIMEDAALRRRLRDAARATVARNHDASIVRTEFQAVLCRAAAKHSAEAVG
jgi:glycosyltransferase involved in cell wall biosynthesis